MSCIEETPTFSGPITNESHKNFVMNLLLSVGLVSDRLNLAVAYLACPLAAAQRFISLREECFSFCSSSSAHCLPSTPKYASSTTVPSPGYKVCSLDVLASSMGCLTFFQVDGSGSGSNGNPALCVSSEAVLVYLKASDTCESGCFNLYVSWYSTFGQQLGGYHAAPGPCINGNYTFQYSPLVEALYRLEPVYNGIPVQTGSCDCPKHKAIGITVSSCSRCAAPPGDPCSPEAGKPHYKSYDAANNVPGGSQLVFDYSRK